MRICKTAVVALGLTAVIAASRPAPRQDGAPVSHELWPGHATPRVSRVPDPAPESGLASVDVEVPRSLEPVAPVAGAPFQDATGAGWWKKHEMVGEIIGCFTTGMAIAAAIISPPAGLVLLGIAAATLHCM